MIRIASLAAAALVLGSAGAASAQDAAAGEKLFRQCKACHVIDKEQNRVGPHLVGIVGRAVGAVDGYKYSNAMIEWGEGKVWDAATLKEYLENPRKVVKGTKMAYPGLKKPEDRDNMVSYLEQAGGGS
ncbi:MAG: cytochrome c family protein [Pseudomonadota bacterium]